MFSFWGFLLVVVRQPTRFHVFFSETISDLKVEFFQKQGQTSQFFRGSKINDRNKQLRDVEQIVRNASSP